MTSYKRAVTLLVTVLAAMAQSPGKPDQELRLVEVDPGHGHLSGLHNTMLAGVSDVVHIYSPLSAELMTHLTAISRYNSRAGNPTHWSIRLFAGPDYLAEMQRESSGAIVALSGRNSTKISYIQTALKGGQHVF